MDRIFFGERFRQNPLDIKMEEDDLRGYRKKKCKIGVVGIAQGVGTTFVATSLAYLLAGEEERSCVSYVEMDPPRPGREQIYYAAALDKRFGGRRFVDFFRLNRRGEALDRYVNLHKGINWVVHRDAGDCAGCGDCDGSGGDRGRGGRGGCGGNGNFPLDQLAGSFVVADNPGMEYLHRYDLVIAVIDPAPGKVFAGAERYQALSDLEKSGLSVRWVVNRDNTMVNHSELRRFLELKDYLTIPLFPQEVFYKGQYECRLPIEILMIEEGWKDWRDCFEALQADAVAAAEAAAGISEDLMNN